MYMYICLFKQMLCWQAIHPPPPCTIIPQTRKAEWCMKPWSITLLKHNGVFWLIDWLIDWLIWLNHVLQPFHKFMVISGQGRNLGPGHNALLFLIDPKGSLCCQNHRQFYTQQVYIATEPPTKVIQQTSQLVMHQGVTHPCTNLSQLQWSGQLVFQNS